MGRGSTVLCSAGAQIWAGLSDLDWSMPLAYPLLFFRYPTTQVLSSAVAGGGVVQGMLGSMPPKMGKRHVHEHHRFLWFILPARLHLVLQKVVLNST
jgi:hypothetical protein